MRIFLFTLLACAPALAQAPPDPTLQELLKEVRALRMALERSNQIAPRVQIALSRMQAQEERVRTANRQLQDIRERIAGTENRRAEAAANMKRLETLQVQIVDPANRKQIEVELNQAKAESELIGTAMQQFRAREGEAQSQLMAEQARASEIDDFLRKLERALEPNQ